MTCKVDAIFNFIFHVAIYAINLFCKNFALFIAAAVRIYIAMLHGKMSLDETCRNNVAIVKQMHHTSWCAHT